MSYTTRPDDKHQASNNGEISKLVLITPPIQRSIMRKDSRDNNETKENRVPQCGQRMGLSEGQQRGKIENLRKKLAFQGVVLTTDNKAILPDTVQMWELKATHRLCHKWLINSPTRQNWGWTQWSQGPKRPKSQGKVCAMTWNKARDNPHVITCSLMFCSSSTSMLFDSRAIHSFIFISHVKTLNHQIEPLENGLLISTPSGNCSY